MRKQKITVLILMITLCLTGIWGMKKNTTVWGAVIRVNDVIVPHDIPAVAVEINKSSELITEKLSRGLYSLYRHRYTAYSGVLGCFVCKYETGRRLHNERCTEASA